MQKTNIEWCDSTWNPISGCYYDCPYCYARGTANRFKGCDGNPEGNPPEPIINLKERLYLTGADGKKRPAAYPFGFFPTFHEYRLNDIKKSGFGKTIFVCSMADLFGDWIPDEWILKIFDACKAEEDHRYLFLTKNPQRYLDLHEKGLLPKQDNFWYGTTTDHAGSVFFSSDEYNVFLSVEPVLTPLDSLGLSTMPDAVRPKWIILGAETGYRSEKVVPEKWWVESLVEYCQTDGIPVFMKDSMKPVWGDDIITQFPWEE